MQIILKQVKEQQDKVPIDGWQNKPLHGQYVKADHAGHNWRLPIIIGASRLFKQGPIGILKKLPKETGPGEKCPNSLPTPQLLSAAFEHLHIHSSHK